MISAAKTNRERGRLLGETTESTDAQVAGATNDAEMGILLNVRIHYAGV